LAGDFAWDGLAESEAAAELPLVAVAVSVAVDEAVPFAESGDLAPPGGWPPEEAPEKLRANWSPKGVPLQPARVIAQPAAKSRGRRRQAISDPPP
jgi:hypothetical protein